MFHSVLLHCTWSLTRLNSAPFNCELWALPVSALLFFYCMFPFSKDSPHNCCMLGRREYGFNFPPRVLIIMIITLKLLSLLGLKYKSQVQSLLSGDWFLLSLVYITLPYFTFCII